MTTPRATRALHHGISPLPTRPRSQSFPQKICRRPPPQNHEARSGSRPHQLWIPALLQRPRRLRPSLQLLAWQCHHHAEHQPECVNGKLNSSMQRQTINDHFQPPLINGMDPDEVQLPDEHVGRETTSRFAAYSCGCAFQNVSSNAQNPRWCARCAVIAKRVKKTATLAKRTVGRRGICRHETGANPFWSGGMWDRSTTPTQHQETTKALAVSVMRGKSAFPGGPVPRETLLRIATPVVQVQTPQAGLVEDVRQPSLLSMMGVRTL